MTFRHPVCRDEEGRPGVKVRRGLGTSDDAAADALVKEMNALLGDESYWNIAERRRAEQRFDGVVVRAVLRTHGEPGGRGSGGDSRGRDAASGPGGRLFESHADWHHRGGQDVASPPK